MTMSDIELTIKDNILTIIINRPSKKMPSPGVCMLEMK